MREVDAASGALSVSELLRSVRDVLERRFPLAWVRGELSNVSRAASGHASSRTKSGTSRPYATRESERLRITS